MKLEAAYLKDINHTLKELHQSREQVYHYQKLQTIGALAGGIVHEFNNLLTPILGYSEFIRERMGPESEYYDDMSEIYEAGTRAKEIVEQLLPFSRRETDSTAYGPVNLEAVLQDDTKMVSMILPSNIRLEKGYKDIHGEDLRRRPACQLSPRRRQRLCAGAGGGYRLRHDLRDAGPHL